MGECIKIINKSNCCGCSACHARCPKSCISMEEDEQGFLYPVVNKAECSNCGFCIKACPLMGKGYKISTNPDTIKVYAVKHKNESVRMSSTSGGMFTALSDFVLDNGGAVFGAAYDEAMVVRHICAETKAQRDRCKGSKYVQSDMSDSYVAAEELLGQGKPLLFTGTPCQIAGLYSYLGRNYDNLYSCDLVCHGVPSPGVFRKYIRFMEEKYGDRVVDVQFRNKDISWRIPTMFVKMKNTIISNILFHNSDISLFRKLILQLFLNRRSFNPYGRLFLLKKILRLSCHTCAFTSLIRPSDITIADYWGIEKGKPDFDDGKGISLVIVNTKKGAGILGNISNSLIIEDGSLSYCIQPNLREASKPSPDRERFWIDYTSDKSFKELASKYAEYTLMGKVIYLFKKIIEKCMCIMIVNSQSKQKEEILPTRK